MLAQAILGPAGEAVGATTSLAKPLDQMHKLPLERVLCELHDSQIIAGIQTLFDGGVRLWLGDATNATIAETTIERTGRKWAEKDAARWLHKTALHLYPDSKYAKEHGG